MLSVKFPPKPYNDFGDAHVDGCDLRKWIDEEIDQVKQLNYIFSFVKNNTSCFTKKEIKNSLVLSDGAS